jgi:V/A-type H+/Na+-transporting ATPase subunit F
MVRIAAAGTSEFIVGFRLAGIKDTIQIDRDAFKEMKALRGRKDLGIIIIDEKIMEGLEMHERNEIESSVDPVFIPVSTKGEQESLRRLIKKSVGVDLWK